MDLLFFLHALPPPIETRSAPFLFLILFFSLYPHAAVTGTLSLSLTALEANLEILPEGNPVSGQQIPSGNTLGVCRHFVPLGHHGLNPWTKFRSQPRPFAPPPSWHWPRTRYCGVPSFVCSLPPCCPLVLPPDMSSPCFTIFFSSPLFFLAFPASRIYFLFTFRSV